MQRRYRLSRSQDFDAVYRKGRSASTRYLVVHWFPREDDDGGAPRLGLAVPRTTGTAVSRNRMKRRLRELWRSRVDRMVSGVDYVVVVRPGLIEAAEARGADWLGERLDEVLGKASA